MRTICHKLLMILTAVLILGKPISAQEIEPKDAYGFWAGTMVSKTLGAEKKWNVGVLAQCHYISHEGVSKMDQVFARPSVSYAVKPWLRLHYETDLVGSQKGFNVSTRLPMALNPLMSANSSASMTSGSRKLSPPPKLTWMSG